MSLAQYSELLAGNIDFVGQEKAQFILRKLFNLLSVSSFLVGLIYQNLFYTVVVFAAGLVIAALVTIPPFGFYNKNNLKYLQVKNKEFASDNVSATIIAAPSN